MSRVLGCGAGKPRNSEQLEILDIYLGGRRTMAVKVFLEIRFRPRFVEPVSRVECGLSKLLRNTLVVLASSSEKGITLARMGRWYSILVQERLELRVGPAA